MSDYLTAAILLNQTHTSSSRCIIYLFADTEPSTNRFQVAPSSLSGYFLYLCSLAAFVLCALNSEI